MHELGLSEAILEAALRRARGRRLTSVRVRVGGHPVDPAVINHGFQVAAVGTVAADAVVDLVMEPAVAVCRRCGHQESADDPLAAAICRACGGVDVHISGDEHVVLESIAVEAD